MAVTTVERATTAPATENETPVPLLNNGDRLTRAEFEKSELFPGLWLLPDALLAGDLSRVLETLQLGLDSQEHKTFCAALTRRLEEAK